MLLGFSLVLACTSQSCAPAEQRGASAPEAASADPQRDAEGSSPFHPDDEVPPSAAPQPADDVAANLHGACTTWDAALGRVAQALADDAAHARPPLEAADVEARLREEGAPYVWPRAWTLAGGAAPSGEVLGRARKFVDSQAASGERRCGGAEVPAAQGRIAAAVVVVDALADLAPVPANVRVGSWVDVEARLLVEHSGAKVIVLGPRGLPRPVPTALSGNSVRGRFAADREGPWLVQVLADVSGGPRPVLEVLVIAGNGPRRAQREPAPGESAAGSSKDAAGLLAMLNAARQSEQTHPLGLDEALTALATEQAHELLRTRRVAHDLGTGDPQTRVESAGIEAAFVGENAAHADTLARAHRALWSSPSHRSNMLDDRFDSIGIGVADDADGSVWVCELFARLAR